MVAATIEGDLIATSPAAACEDTNAFPIEPLWLITRAGRLGSRNGSAILVMPVEGVIFVPVDENGENRSVVLPSNIPVTDGFTNIDLTGWFTSDDCSDAGISTRIGYDNHRLSYLAEMSLRLLE